jgi:hypothetical protein
MKAYTFPLTREELEVLILGSHTFRERVISSLLSGEEKIVNIPSGQERRVNTLKQWIRDNCVKYKDQDVGKINAIKGLRSNFAEVSLADAKELVENVWSENK